MNGRVTGWAFNIRAPERRLTVTLIGDDGSRVETCADHYRADLHRAGFGDGHHGFAVPVSALRGWRRLRAAADGIRLAPMSPCPLEQVPAGRSLTHGALRLWIDSVRRNGYVSGWVIDTRDPDRRIALTLQRRGVVLAHAQATRFRADLAESDTDALHGFVLTFRPDGPGVREIVDETDGRVLARVSPVP